jgi:3-dehydroquinate synthase class II
VEGAANSKHVAKNAELKSLVKSHAWKIAELEAVCADLKHEKEGVTVGYHRMKKCLLKKWSGKGRSS